MLDRWEALLEEIGAEVFELGARNIELKILTIIEHIARYHRLRHRGQHLLHLLDLCLETADRSLHARDVFSCLLLELVDAVLNKAVVKVFATEVGMAAGGLDLKDAVLHLKDRYIKGATAQIEDHHVFLAFDF